MDGEEETDRGEKETEGGWPAYTPFSHALARPGSRGIRPRNGAPKLFAISYGSAGVVSKEQRREKRGRDRARDERREIRDKR